VLREQIDQAFMFEEIVGTSSALQGVLSRLMKELLPPIRAFLLVERLELVRNWLPAPSISDLVGRNAPL
jgi:hypothetical protein